MGMSLAAKENLHAAELLRAAHQALGIRQQQISPFVGGYAASKANGEDVAAQRDPGPLRNRLDERALGLGVRLLDLAQRNVDRVTKLEIIFAPAGNGAIEDGLHRSSGPGGGVHPVGDGIDGVFGETFPARSCRAAWQRR